MMIGKSSKSVNTSVADLLIVDASVESNEILVDGLAPSTDVIRLEKGKAPLEQIAAAVANRNDIGSLHILSHGEPGALALCGERIDENSLNENAWALAAIKAALGEGAKLALWACSTATGVIGKSFVEALEAATGADVFAALQPVGALTKGGTWNIGTPAPFSPAAMAAYPHTLPTFDGDGGSVLGTDYTEADNGDGITLTVTFADDVAGLPTQTAGVGVGTIVGQGGSVGNVFFGTWANESTIATVSFNAAVTITSFQYIEGDTNEAGTYTFTPIGGSGSPTTITVDAGAFTTTDGTLVTPTDWFGVTGFTVENSAGAFSPALDTIVYNINTTPLASIDNTTLAYTENNSAVQIDSAGTVSDPDGDGDWNTGTLVAQITGNNEAADQLSFSDTDGDGTAITIVGNDVFLGGATLVGTVTTGGTVTNGTALTFTFNTNATNAVVQEILQNIRYMSTSEDPSELDRTITFTATDGSGASANDTRTVQVSAVEDAPTVSGLTNRGAAEDITGAPNFSGVTIADADTTGNITVTITASDTGAVLGAVDGSGVGVAETAAGDNVVTLVGTAANITTYLSNASAITYTSSANRETDDTISIQADDGISTPNAASTATIVITPLNDLPTGTTSTITINEDTARTITTSDFGFSDVDSGDTLVSVRIDVQSITSGTLQLSGTDVTNGDVIAVADINAGNLIYTPAADANGNGLLSFTFSVNDGTAFAASTATLTVDVTDVAELVDDPVNIQGTSANESLVGGNSGDTLIGGGGDDSVVGGAGDDILYAGANDDGNDTINAGSGDDIAGGGSGDDFIEGGDGSDTLYGGSGNDTLFATEQNNENGDTSSNVIWAGSGNDSLFGGLGADTLGGGTGSDQVAGGSGNDTVYGSTGDDTLAGDAGNDTIFGGADSDTLNGGGGDDLLFGGAGSDTVSGGTGSDTLWAGAGDDQLTGGTGADTFIFGATSGNDTVTDFNTSEDTLDLSFAPADFNSIADVESVASEVTQNGQAGVLIDLGDSDSVFVIGISIGDLTASNVVV